MFSSNLNSQGGFLPEERSQRVQSKRRIKRKHNFCKTKENKHNRRKWSTVRALIGAAAFCGKCEAVADCQVGVTWLRACLRVCESALERAIFFGNRLQVDVK